MIQNTFEGLIGKIERWEPSTPKKANDYVKVRALRILKKAGRL